VTAFRAHELITSMGSFGSIGWPTSFDPLKPVAGDLATTSIPDVAAPVIDAWQGAGWTLIQSAPGPTLPLEVTIAQPPAPQPVG